MIEVVPSLYLGDLCDSQNVQNLLEKHISAIVTCCSSSELPNHKLFSEFDYYRVDIDDSSQEVISAYFEDVTQYIHKFVSQGKNILVHCRAGISRSVTIVIAYLVKYCNFSLLDAFIHTYSMRKIISPNIGFMEQLCKYEVELHNRKFPTISLNKYNEWFFGDRGYCFLQRSNPMMLANDEDMIK